MLKRFCLIAVLALPAMQGAVAGYLDENPDEVFAEVYERLGVKLSARVTRDPYVWLRLEELKREPCDQASVTDLALFLEKYSPTNGKGGALIDSKLHRAFPKPRGVRIAADLFVAE